MIIMVIIFLFLIGSAVILQANSCLEKEISLLPPVNFTIIVTGLSKVLLHWKPNPNQDPKINGIKYKVRINTPNEDDYETQKTQSRSVSVLHQGFSASVQTILHCDSSFFQSSWVSAELPAPPGAPGTSVTNLTCVTNILWGDVSLRCTWFVGRNAPEDAQYFLFYRFDIYTEECQEYRKDSWNRNIACWFPETAIDRKGRGQLAVHVNGSSKQIAIKPLDQLFDLHAIDQVNPPVNVTAKLEGNRLFIQWEKPVSNFPKQCFDYEVNIYNIRRDYSKIQKIQGNSFNLVIDPTCKHSLKIRATVHFSCRKNGLWSEWSQSIYVGKDKPTHLTEWILSALMATACFLLLMLFFICRICQVWTKLFPPIPAPNRKVKDLSLSNIYEKTRSSETEIEVISYVEDPGLDNLDDSVF
ncbi:interleukin-5 receptor subunit alpha isoform X1 [Vombatus ursinus]|uniref:Interleukin 5 receptor subunit alpha n=1 Tax=Vombatus ursinus TaxID=29139 RepID=A0A4X2KIF6_VOMUR|nr:interleukin-5 receptor subunit alpha isoform X1 [Vombatus ursinus]XP_027719733.1 interleukin-5 receptor subunit alpha isoform X1 [Vombatus ursinus]XP_027719734.1 interleukin-5 receptor subunit alpha isoform X1 [Vombatus ursinus]XP_027719735.1 interleukin-5 receptor subunit alpha isoform X1 [Vombatus ursinus]